MKPRFNVIVIDAMPQKSAWCWSEDVQYFFLYNICSRAFDMCMVFLLTLPKYIQIWLRWCLEWIWATGSSSLQDADRRWRDWLQLWGTDRWMTLVDLVVFTYYIYIYDYVWLIRCLGGCCIKLCWDITNADEWKGVNKCTDAQIDQQWPRCFHVPDHEHCLHALCAIHLLQTQGEPRHWLLVICYMLWAAEARASFRAYGSSWKYMLGSQVVMVYFAVTGAYTCFSIPPFKR